MSGFSFKEIFNEKNEEDSAESENKENNELTLF